jgi:hypothetical protein
MAITSNGGKLHWNYFLALDRDLESVSRYVEFAPPNFEVYSLELAHLLFAAASEVDVVAKLICEQIGSSTGRYNIDRYREVLLPAIPSLPTTRVTVPRYGLTFHPWENWASETNPDWWRAYNNVKHERNAFFQQANLKNALNALGALSILNFHYYACELRTAAETDRSRRDVTRQLLPTASLVRFDEAWYDTLMTLE